MHVEAAGRTRLDRRDLSLRFADVIGTAGPDAFKLSAGYLYSDVNPYFYYDTPTVPASYFTPRNELTLSATTKYGNYHFTAFARRDLALNKMVAAGVHATYENECFIFDVRFTKRYTSVNGDNGYETVLFTVTLKTIGAFGFHAS